MTRRDRGGEVERWRERESGREAERERGREADGGRSTAQRSAWPLA
jgi:hypothetical protein